MSRLSRWTSCLAALFAAALQAPCQSPAATAQTPQELEVDWRMPFRSPQTNTAPPEELYRQLRPMYAIAKAAMPDRRSLDATGAEQIDDPAWRAAREEIAGAEFEIGYLSLVIRESRSVNDRALAFYGGFYCPDPRWVFSIIEHIPGEPDRAIRADAFARAVDYLSVQFGRRNEGDLAEWQALKVGPAGEKPPKPGEFSNSLDPAPFVAMLFLKEPVDVRQALWFLARAAEFRPAFGRAALDMARERLPRLIATDDDAVRHAVADFLAAVDPDPERVPPEDLTGEDLTEWLDQVLYALFPPIRRISDGLFELWPGADRDQLVAVGSGILRNGSAGEPATGRTAAGQPWSGMRIAMLPEPLDRLGLAVGDAITAIDGMPVARPAQVLRALEAAAKHRRGTLVEFVTAAGRSGALEYRFR